MTLKELRMWHWEKALECSVAKRQMEGRMEECNETESAVMYQYARQGWNLHMGAVQALNDVLPGTAEQDCERRDLEAAKSRVMVQP